MKAYVVLLILIGDLFLISCKKSRTCSCKISTTQTSVITPRGTGTSSTSVNTTSEESSITKDKVKKDDMVRLYNCNDRTETSTSTYTTIVFVPSDTSGFSHATTADVASTTEYKYDCAIK